jgi:formylglycine-generating enzyme required for sulfatase activity
MMIRGRLLSLAGLGSFLLAQPLGAQTVTNVRAQQLTDKTVEVLYDLSGAAAGGTAVSVVFSSDGGTSYDIRPAAAILSGAVGAAVGNGINKRLIWDARQTLPAGTFGSGFRAQVTAESGSSATCCVLSCSASTNPSTQQTGSSIQFVASTSASNCSGTPTYSWTFGDGSTSASQNPIHAYTTAGTFVWSMTARAGDTTCTSGGTVGITGGGSSGGQEVLFTLPGGVQLVLVKIPAGTFLMGAPETEQNSVSNERPVHQVTLTSDYYLGKYEVTQAQWQAVMGTNPSSFSSCGGSCPVENVSWNDIHGANGFIEKLNQLLGTTKFRPPTEAEWERAARAGTQTRFSFGDALDGDNRCGANAAANSYVWWCGNAASKTHEVGTMTANPYGLYDMHGNVGEWVEDLYGTYPSTAQTNPTGPASGEDRVSRGGGWSYYLYGTRSAHRMNRYYPDYRGNDLGFRLARSL